MRGKRIMEKGVEAVTMMTKYEMISTVLSIVAIALSILIPLAQWIWKRWITQPKLNYYPTGRAFVYCNLSGPYLQVDGVFEALHKPVSIKGTSIRIERVRDEKKLKLDWLRFRSPVSQNFMGLQASAAELAHPFRIDADHIACAFIEFGDSFASVEKTANLTLEEMTPICNKIKGNCADYYSALVELKKTHQYSDLKALLEKNLFWEIGKYKATLSARYGKKEETFQMCFSITEQDYKQFVSGIEELASYPLKRVCGLNYNYQPVIIEMK